MRFSNFWRCAGGTECNGFDIVNQGRREMEGKRERWGGEVCSRGGNGRVVALPRNPGESTNLRALAFI